MGHATAGAKFDLQALVLGHALKDAWWPRHWNLAAMCAEDQDGDSLLHPDVLQELLRTPEFDLPWAATTRRVPPGKLYQISQVTARRPFYGPFDRSDDPVGVAPLLSQPVIEICFRIPVDMQMRDHRDRSLTRAAFKQDLPPEIEQRRGKGAAEQLAAQVLTRNRPILREWLLDGCLVEARLVNRARLEQALSESPFASMRGSAAVFDLMGAEIWARTWLT